MDAKWILAAGVVLMIIMIKFAVEFKENEQHKEENLERVKKHIPNQNIKKTFINELTNKKKQGSKVIDLEERRKERSKAVLVEKKAREYSGKNEVRFRK